MCFTLVLEFSPRGKSGPAPSPAGHIVAWLLPKLRTAGAAATIRRRETCHGAKADAGYFFVCAFAGAALTAGAGLAGEAGVAPAAGAAGGFSSRSHSSANATATMVGSLPLR